MTLTADVALKLANMTKDAQLAPLEAAAEDAGVDPTHFYTTRTLAQAFLAACDKDRMESFAPLLRAAAPPDRRRWPLCCPIHSYRRWCGAL